MAEKVISLRLQLKGNQSTIQQLDAVTLPLEEAGKLLDNIKAKSKELDTLTRKMKGLSQELQEVNKQLESVGTGKGVDTLINKQATLTNKIKETSITQTQMRKELLELDKGTARYKELVKIVAQHKQKQAEVNMELRKQAKDFEATKFAAGSYKQLNFQLIKARDTYRQMSEAQRKGAGGQALLKDISQLDTKLKAIDASMGQYTRNVGNYSSALSGLKSVAARYLSFTALLAAGSQVISQNAEISDSIADVARKADTTIPVIRKLADELKFRDTRTSLADQLQIAQIGAQLGIAEDQLAGFTAAVDVLNVALGDQFGGVEDLTDKIGGLRNVLIDFRTDDIAGDILHLGNALSILEKKGIATADNIVDISSRLAGLGEAVGLDAAQIIGLSDTLDELRVAPERAATSIQKVLTEVAKSPKAFAAFTNKTVPEFTKAVNEDLVGAFVEVLNGINGSNLKTTEFIGVLDKLGLKGQRAIEVFSKLAGNTDLLTERIALTRSELTKTDSVYSSFALKNETLGAEIEKLKNSLLNLFSNSVISAGLAAFVSGLRSIITTISDLVSPNKRLQKEFIELTDSVNTLQSSLPKLLDRYEELKMKTHPTTDEQKELSEVIKRIGELTPTAITEIDKYGNALAISADKSREFLEAEKDRLEFVNKESIKAIEDEINSLQILKKAKEADLKVGKKITSTTGSGFGQTSVKLTVDEIRKLQGAIRDYQTQIDGATAQLNFLKTGSALTAEQLKEDQTEVTELTEEQLAKIKELQDNADKEEKKRREQRERDIKSAAENIQRLQLEALGKTFEGRRQRLEKEAELAINALVGTPEQVALQTKLIGEQLKKSLDDLAKEAQAAREKVLQDIESFRQQIEQGAADANLFGAQTNVDEITRFYQQAVEQLRLTRAQQFAELEKALTKGEITIGEFENRRLANERDFSQKSIDLKKMENAELFVAESELLSNEFKQREEAFKAELEQIRQHAEDKKRALLGPSESGAITPETAVGIQDLEALANQQKLNAEQKFLAEKDRLNSEFILRQTQRQTDLSEQELSIISERNDRLIQEQQQYQNILSSSLENIAKSFGEFFTGQEKSTEDFLKSILSITIDTIKDIILLQLRSMVATALSQPDSVATFGATGVARIAIITGLVNAAFAGIKGLVNSFEEGGVIPGTSSGEGEAQGPSHSQGGIKTIMGGHMVELEGKEHVLRNGHESYVINKRSSKLFRDELKGLHGGVKVFNPMKRLLAEQINTFKGFGRAFAPVRKFQGGGALSISPLPAPALSQSSAAIQGDMVNLFRQMEEMINATNKRIDRLTVIANPSQLLSEGKARSEIKKARSL